MKRKISEEIDKYLSDASSLTVANPSRELKVNPSYSTFDGLSTRMPGGLVIGNYRFIPMSLIGSKQLVYTYETMCASYFGSLGAGTGTHALILSAPTAIQVTSTDVNDTLVGTGAQRVRIYGYNAAFQFQFEDIDLNGQTPAVGALSFFRIINCIVIQNNTVGVKQSPNLGTIFFTPAGDATVAGVPSNADRIVNVMSIGTGATLSTNITVPPGAILLLNKLNFNTGMEVNNDERCTLTLKVNTGQSGYKTIANFYTTQNNQTLFLESNTLPNAVTDASFTDLIAVVKRDGLAGTTNDIKVSLFVDCYMAVPV